MIFRRNVTALFRFERYPCSGKAIEGETGRRNSFAEQRRRLAAFARIGIFDTNKRKVSLNFGELPR